MPTATSEDTEITLGTGKMLALFFGLVALCAVFFSFGFSLGKNSVLKPSAAEASLTTPASTAPIRPSAVKTQNAPAPPTESTDTPAPKPDAQPPANAATTDVASAGTTPAPTEVKTTTADSTPLPALNGYYVQVAAVSKQEDADALVDALKKKQYPAFSANTASDKLFHVQVGPYGEIKDAETMRAKLVSDGYNPILKK